jgi:hypothetical protein
MTDIPRNVLLERGRSVRLGATLAVVIAAAFLVWLLLVRDNGSSSSSVRRTNAVAASVAGLKAVAREVGHPVYWAGALPGKTYELTQLKNGQIYIRYLPAGTELGDPKPKYLTIGTYPSATGFATLERGARRRGARVDHFRSGAIAVTYAKSPTSVFFAFPSSPYLVEVFDPSPARARSLVLNGQVRLIR